MKIVLKIRIGKEIREVVKDGPVVLEDLKDELVRCFPYTILLALVNGRYEELTSTVDKDSEIEFLDIRNHSAEITYQNSLSLLYIKAAQDVTYGAPVKIENSLNKGLFTEIETERPLTDEDVRKIEERMTELIEADIPIIKETYGYEEAIGLWEEYGCTEKAELLRNSPHVTEPKFYSLQGYTNFFFGFMAPSTGYVRHFELVRYKKGVLLRFPQPAAPDRIPPSFDYSKIYRAFAESKKWHRLLGLSYLPDLNRTIKKGRVKDLILLSEALHEKTISDISDMIAENRKRIILIAGPSSSGKTTFAKRLCVQLRVNGLNPLYLGLDDYFVERCDSPVDSDGNYNFENLDALDVDLFNDQMNRLLAGETVDMPEFDFVTGRKVFGKRITSVGAGEPIVIEGIHGLNGKLTEKIADREKFKIYISPFTQLNIDRHNRVTTTDDRMLRRIVRDYEFRNNSAAETIAQWPKVRAGEDVNIFPYNGEADVVFNSALGYELAVLKKHALPILQEVPEGSEEYAEAERLMRFIGFFDVIEDEYVIPNNSIIREFIGGSIFVE